MLVFFIRHDSVMLERTEALPVLFSCKQSLELRVFELNQEAIRFRNTAYCSAVTVCLGD